MAKQPNRDSQENRKIDKRKGVEKKWRKSEFRWKYSGDPEAEDLFIDKRRSAPPQSSNRASEDERRALVVQTSGNDTVIRDESSSEEYTAKPRRSTTTDNPNATLVSIGDWVRYIPQEHGPAYISHIEARDSVLSRRSVSGRDAEQVLVANCDHVVVVIAPTESMFRPGLIDRYLVSAAMGGIEASICINKMDLVDEDVEEIINEIVEVYTDLDYIVHKTSCESGEGIVQFTGFLQGRISVFSGHSGVGKTSLLNVIIPGLDERTQDISDQSQRGIHTTTHSSLFALPGDGFIADTPGIREFGIYHFDSGDLHTYYPEFVEHSVGCKFPDCTHIHEPKCAVKEAVENGEIHELRYRNYLQILNSEQEYERDY